MSDSTHESIKDLAAAYALDALDGEDTRTFERQLERSEELQRAVAEYREIGALLPLATPRAKPHATLRKRVLDRVRQEARDVTPITRQRRTHWIFGLAWAAAIGGLLVGGTQWRNARNLSGELAALQQRADELTAALAGREATLDNILEPSTVLFLLTSTEQLPPGIQLFWNRRDNSVVLHAFELQPAPTSREYQLWFLPRDGAPIPAITFSSDADGHRLVTLPGPPADVEIIGAAVTIEPVGGSTVPTPPIMLLGEIETN